MADDALSPDEEQLADFWHGQGMSNAGVAGMLGTFSQEAGSGGYNAFNDSSGASGAYQYLGSRAKAETSYASARGGDPWDPQIQNEYAERELRGQADDGNERAVGTALFNATDPAEAADNMVRGFERPGGDVIDAESARAQARARAVHPLLEARYGGDAGRSNPNMVAPLTNSGPKETYDGSDPEYQKAFAAMGQAIQPAGTPGKWDHATLPPTVQSPQPNPHGDAMSLMGQAMQDQIYADKDPGNQPAPGQTWGPIGHALLSVVPRGLARGFLTTLGLPADLANAAGDFYAAHPNNAAVVGMAGGNPGSAMGMALAQSLGLPTSADQLPVYDPNTKGIHIPAGTSDLQALVKNTTGVDTAPEYNNTGDEVLGHMAEFVGAAASPGGIVSDVKAAASGAASVTKSVLGMLFHHVLAPAGISGGADVGQWAVDKASGSQAAGNATGIALRAGLAGGLIAGVGRGARAATNFAENAPRTAIEQAMTSGHGELEAGGATQQAIANLDKYQEPIPGYTTPAALQTGDAALQQFSADVLANDQRYHNDFTKPGGQAEKNINALEAMRPAGDADDPVQAVQNMQTRRQSMIDMRVAQARDAAQDAEEQATTGTTGATMPQGGGAGQTAGYQRGQAYIDELREARNDAFTHADESWENARNLGFTNVPADIDPMYGQLENLMSENVRLKQGADFPWQIVNDLYRDGNPRGMFDKLGNRIPSTVGNGNWLFNNGATLEQLKGVDSRLGNAIRMEQDAISAPGNRGNPALLRGMMQTRDAVWGAIERGAAQAGPEHTVALQNAMDATAQAYGTFGHGLVGQLLNERGGATNAPEILRKYLGNTQNAIQASSMFRAAMEQRTGAAAARENLGGMAAGGALGAAPQTQFMNTLADWMRQDYLNTRADLGAKAAQKWMTTRQGMFSSLSGNQAIDDLHSQLMNWQNNADVLLPQVEGWAKKQGAELDSNAAQLFLNGDPGKRLNTALKSADAMGQIIQDVKSDGTGRAFRGLQDMFTNRVFAEAQVRDPLRPGQTYYSGTAAKKFLDGVQPALDRLGQEDPAWAQGLRRVVDTMAIEDRARMGTGLQLGGIPGMQKGGWSAMGSLGTKALQYSLAHVVGRNLPAAGLQGEALSSQFGKELAGQIPMKMQKAIGRLDPTNAVHAAVRDALHDPEKLRGLLAPTTGPSGARWAGHIEPWLKATGVELPQGWLNPQNQPEPGNDTLP